MHRMPDPSHLLVARVHGVAARSADLTAAALELAGDSRGQEGCLSYDVLAEPEDRAELVLLSAWRTQADMRAHFASPAYARYSSAVTDLLARPSDATIYGVAGAVHPLPDLSREPQRAD
jgi:quinol monooxygenase YgiN